jgi:hypothetical protein
MSTSKFYNLPPLIGDVAQAVVPVNPDTGTVRLSRTFTDIMIGAVPGLAGVAINAFNAALPNGASAVIEEIPRVLLPSAVGVAMTIRSTSALDVGNVVRVGALGAGYVPLALANFVLNGTTPVSLFSAAPLTRINLAARISGDFVGTVLIENAGVTYAAIAAGQQTMRSSQYAVPAGYRFFLLDLMTSLAKDTAAGVSCGIVAEIKPVASTGFGALSSWNLRQEGVGAFDWRLTCPQGLSGPIDLRVSALASSTGVSAQSVMSGILQDLSVSQL